MPLVLDTPRSANRETFSRTAAIEIALLNNLGDSALEMGERQIVDLLAEAAGRRVVRLRFFSLPPIARSAKARGRLDERYTPFADLMRSRVDGLIVTGCEPRMTHLPEEAFWHGLANVVDWAEHNTRSTIWSCLAAHAAVLHLDGIARQPLREKCAGMFAVERVRDHPLTAGLRGTPYVPHSRWNGLPENELVASGYQILTRSPAIGVDLFVKQWRSLFVYLQGHPEYDAAALGREYRRDVARYLDGTTATYPALPHGYFNTETEASLRGFAEQARRTSQPPPASAFSSAIRGSHRPRRRGFAVMLFRNWLDHLGTATDIHVA